MPSESYSLEKLPPASNTFKYSFMISHLILNLKHLCITSPLGLPVSQLRNFSLALHSIDSSPLCNTLTLQVGVCSIYTVSRSQYSTIERYRYIVTVLLMWWFVDVTICLMIIIHMMLLLMWCYCWCDVIVDVMLWSIWCYNWYDVIIDVMLPWFDVLIYMIYHWCEVIIDMILSLTWCYHW